VKLLSSGFAVGTSKVWPFFAVQNLFFGSADAKRCNNSPFLAERPLLMKVVIENQTSNFQLRKTA